MEILLALDIGFIITHDLISHFITGFFIGNDNRCTKNDLAISRAA